MEREVLFGNCVRLPSGDVASSCEAELLKLLHEVDIAFLENHKVWRTKYEKAEAVARQKDSELRQAREEIIQLTKQIEYLETVQSDIVDKYDKRIADLKNDVVKIKKRYQSLKVDNNRCNSEKELDLLEKEVELWKSRVMELEKQLRQVEDDVEIRMRELYDDKIKSAIADKERMIDRLNEKVLELTKIARLHQERCLGLESLGNEDQLVAEAMKTFVKRPYRLDGQELHRQIQGHMQELMNRLQSERKTLET